MMRRRAAHRTHIFLLLSHQFSAHERNDGLYLRDKSRSVSLYICIARVLYIRTTRQVSRLSLTLWDILYSGCVRELNKKKDSLKKSDVPEQAAEKTKTSVNQLFLYILYHVLNTSLHSAHPACQHEAWSCTAAVLMIFYRQFFTSSQAWHTHKHMLTVN